MDTNRVLIVGGGIAGLSAAYRLSAAVPTPEIVLVESSNRLGGKLVTDYVGGCVVEGGADSFLASKPQATDLCRELGIDTDLVGTRPEKRGSYVMKDGELHPIPEGLTGLVPSRLEPLLASNLFTAAGKRRIAAEPSRPARTTDEDESLLSFIDRRFGREAYDRLIEPLMAGIYAGDGSQLSVRAAFPQLQQMEQTAGSVVAALNSAPRPVQPRSGFLTPRQGLAFLVRSLRAHLHGTSVLQGRSAQSVMRRVGGYSVSLDGGSRLDARAVVLATPVHVSASLLESAMPELAAPLHAIPAVSSAIVALSYRDLDIPNPVEGYGYVVPRHEGRPVLACTWVSNKFPDRAPPGVSLIRVFLGRAGQQDMTNLSDADLVQVARDELQDVTGTTHSPLFTRVFRWPKAMPQYTLGHRERISAVEQTLQSETGLFLAGNAYAGVGIPDCIRSGERAADGALRVLALPRPI